MLAFLVSVVWVTKMTSSLKQSRNRQAGIGSNRRKTICLLIAVVLAFLICLLPHRTLILLVSISPDIFIGIVGDSCFSKIFEILHILSLLHNCLNPLMYNFVSKKFNTALWALISINKGHGHCRVPDGENIICRLRSDTDDCLVDKVDLQILTSDNI